MGHSSSYFGTSIYQANLTEVSMIGLSASTETSHSSIRLTTFICTSIEQVSSVWDLSYLYRRCGGVSRMRDDARTDAPFQNDILSNTTKNNYRNEFNPPTSVLAFRFRGRIWIIERMDHWDRARIYWFGYHTRIEPSIAMNSVNHLEILFWSGKNTMQTAPTKNRIA